MSRPPRRGHPARKQTQRLTALASGALVALATVVVTPTTASAVTDTDPSFQLIPSDLEFMLEQIQISESHAAGNRLLCDTRNDTSGKCVRDPMLPHGLRTVDGSFNNLTFEDATGGTSGHEFPRLLPTEWRQADPVPTGAGWPPNTAGEADVCEDGATCYGQTSGFVYDSEPRTISNLIVDQTTSNPAAVDAAANTPGSTTDAEGNIFIPDSSPDEALSPSVNTFFAFFGQFFDHGLDLVKKGGNGTIVVPLQPDDPLYSTAPGAQNFMMLTRATNQPGPDGVLGTADDVREHRNITTPFVDQNQTYTSHPAHQVFLREYELVDGRPIDTGRLLNGVDGGLPTWDDVKRQAREVLGIQLGGPADPNAPDFQPGDFPDVVDVPQVVVDLYGNFVPGDNGFPQLAQADGAEGGSVVEGNPAAPISTANALRTGHPFLEDIAHGATPDPNDLSGYNNVLLGQHYVTGDGRGNENIGLSAVHHIFHSEHNRNVEHIKQLLEDNPELQAKYADQSEADDWSYNTRVFQAARFTTEMIYQHLVFEEFARRIQPAIDEVVFNENSYDATIDPSITAEFAHVVYRFGHSLLPQEIAREGFGTANMPLLQGFLNPVALHCRTVPAPGNTCAEGDQLTPGEAVGSIMNGTTQQPANQIDELVTSTLRNSLLGLPLDLPAINIMRARDAGVPSLQTARETFYNASGNTNLKPYTSWHDFGLSLKNGNNFGRGTSNASLVNFVAAYGKHPSIQQETTIAGKRAAADLLVNGAPTIEYTSRIAGADRYAVAAGVSASEFQPGVPVVYLASGLVYPDALAGGPLAAAEGGPILLAHQNGIPAATARELLRLDPARIVVLGGPGTVSNSVLTTLESYTTGTVSRIAGADRFEVAVNISKALVADGTAVERVYVASGANFPDALAGAPIAARDGSPILLVPSSSTGVVPAAVTAELARLNPAEIVVLGGPASVSDMTANNLRTIAPVLRMGGNDRFDVVNNLTQDAFPDGAETVYVTTGMTFADALTGAVVAGRDGAPIMLLPSGATVPQKITDEIARLAPSRIVMLGGPASISAGQEAALAALAPVVEAPADRLDFMNSTNAWAGPSQFDTTTGLEEVDFWIGGLAEKLDPFGGMLGSTFNFVFEKQLEDLQFGDRFYYLFRNQGHQLFAALESESFADLIRRNSDASELPADIFSVNEPVFDLELLPTPLPAQLHHMPDGTYRWDGDEHVEIHGNRTLADKIRGGQGDDALWGYGGDDRIEGDTGNDNIKGGAGNDILTDTFGDDTINGGLGNDAIDGGYGIDLLFGSHGDDFVVKGHDTGTSAFLGTGNDIAIGGTGRDNIFGGEGEDWIEGGDHADLLMGDNADQFQNDTWGGADVLIAGGGSDDYDAEGGDDVMVGQLGGTDRFHGMNGWDIVSYYGEGRGVDADLTFNLLQPPDVTAIRDRFLRVEALSGGEGDDILRGINVAPDDLTGEGDAANKLTQEGLDRIAGLEAILRPASHTSDYALRFMANPLEIDSDGVSNLILGGPGGDVIEGRFGDDFLDGDAYLAVQLEHNGTRYNSAKELRAAVFAGQVDPGDITIVREIVETQDDAVDTAVFGDTYDSYDIAHLGDGYWQLSHTAASELEESEGSDVIRNFEMIQFADGCRYLPDLSQGGEPTLPLEACPAAGTVTFGGQIDPPTEDQPLTASIQFAEGITNPTDIRFNWQLGETGEEWEPSATGDNLPNRDNPHMDTFTPGDGDGGALLRVVVSFRDDAGVLRTLVSDALPQVLNINDRPTQPTLNPQSPRVGNGIIPSGFTDADGTAEATEAGMTYTWERSLDGATWETIPSTGPTTGYRPVDGDAGYVLRVRIDYTDDQGTAETVYSVISDPVIAATEPLL